MNIENENKVAVKKEDNMNNLDWKDQFSREIYELTGHRVANYNIYSDERGWYYYIEAQSLEANHPLIINHYRGQLFAVIPLKEYQELEAGTIDINYYIENAYWNFGYYWGGGSLIGGVFWKPLEDTTGIHNKERVKRYLSILACRTHRRSCGYMPPEEQCGRCHVKQCPFSKVEEKNRGASWEKEVNEHDYRVDMFNAVAKRVKTDLQIEVSGYLCHKGENALLVPHTWKKETCTLYLPVTLTNDLLYHPGERDWKSIAQNIQLELGVLFDKNKRVLLDSHSDSEFCWEFFKSCFVQYDNENEKKEEKQGFFKKIMSFFAK